MSESISIPVSPEMQALLTAQHLERNISSIRGHYAALNRAFKRGDAKGTKACLDLIAEALRDTTETVRHLDLVLFVAAPPVEAPDA